MIIPQGFWITPGGRLFKTNDHFNFAMSHKRMFGITRKDERYIDPMMKLEREDENGITLAEKILRKKFIRIRSDGKNNEIQLWVLTSTALFDIKLFLLKTKSTGKVLIDEISTGSTFYEPVEKFINDEMEKYARNKGRKK